MNVFVLTSYEQHHEDPPDFDVIGVFLTLELAQYQIRTVWDWDAENGVYDAWENHIHYKITPIKIESLT